MLTRQSPQLALEGNEMPMVSPLSVDEGRLMKLYQETKATKAPLIMPNMKLLSQ